LVVAFLAFASPVHSWTFTYDQVPNEASSVATPDGDVVATIRDDVLMLDGVTGAERWRVDWPFLTLFQTAMLPSGDVVMAGKMPGFHVAAYASATGAPLWVYDGSASPGWANNVVSTPDGDVIAVGGGVGIFIAARLDGATGAVEWRHDSPSSPGLGSLAVTGDGQVVIATKQGAVWRVWALSASTGSILWNITLGSGCDPAVVVDAPVVLAHPGGNIFTSYHSCDGFHSIVVKLDAGTGAELWRRTDPRPGGLDAVPLAVLPAGDIVVGSAGGDDMQVEAVSSVSGALLWRWTTPHEFYNPSPIQALLVDASGDVVALGTMDQPIGVLAVRLDGATGAEIWRRRFQGPGGARAKNVAHDAAGDVVVTYNTFGLPNDPAEFHVVQKLHRSDGASFVGTRCGSIVCERCARCDAPDVCTTGPRPDCRVPFGATSSQLQLRRGSTAAADRLSWKWGGGPPSLAADIGDPRYHADEILCLYENAAASPTLLRSDTLSAFTDCDRHPCWSTQSGQPGKPQFSYKASEQSPAGKSSLVVKISGGTGKASRVLWKAKGPALGLGALGLDTPVRAELRSSTGVCWAANYDAGVIRNTATEFKAKGGS
jgi:outer membrane protein assembly factor BamB